MKYIQNGNTIPDMAVHDILLVPFSLKRIILITLIESIFVWASITFAWYFKGDIWIVFGPGFVYNNALYHDCLLGILGFIPLIFSIIIAKQYDFYPGINQITNKSILFIFGKDFLPFTVGGSALVIALMAGIGEEMFFRAIVQQELSVLISEPIGIAVSVLLFGAMHAVTPGYAVLTSIAGIYLSGLYIACGRSILVVALSHTLYDWMVFMMVHYEVTHNGYVNL